MKESGTERWCAWPVWKRLNSQRTLLYL